MDRQEENNQMRAAGFVFDPTQSGHIRWTHFEKCVTCLRSPHMSQSQWEAHMAEKIAEAKAEKVI